MPKKTFLFYLILFFIISLAGFYFFANKPAQAGSSDTLSGWAWSENIGWISFNCTNQGSCGASNYGVSFDSNTGVMSGYAWSENVGWLSFNRSDTGAPPGAPYQSGSYIAKYDSATHTFSGWARFLANGGGWDGWVKLSGSNYGVTLSVCDLQSYAWGSDVVGWISFNCSNNSVCGQSNYKVTSTICTDQLPQASAFNRNAYYCDVQPYYSLAWLYTDPDGEDETQFQLQVDNNNFAGCPGAGCAYDSGVVPASYHSNTTNTQIVKLIPSGPLAYNTTYRWRVKVWDASGNSNWVEGTSFTTDKHAYPHVNFTWSPAKPALDEQVQFTDTSTAAAGYSIAQWAWIFKDPSGSPSGTDTNQNPIFTFSTKGTNSAALTATDNSPERYSCTTPKNIKISLPLPKWQEITPQ
jgi:hypothetical protein